MATKEELNKKALDLGIELTGQETNAELDAKIKEAEGDNKPITSNATSNKKESNEQMVPLSKVKELIAEALSSQSDSSKPVKIKKVMEHFAHVWRLNGKWVVDFADRNYDYKNKKFIDEYIKDKIHAYNVYNPNKREYETFITLMYEDGSTEDILLNKYIERRTLVYCKIIERKKIDRSFTIGEVEKKKESSDGMMVGTGVMVDQDVEKYDEVLKVETPDKKVLELPDYVIC